MPKTNPFGLKRPVREVHRFTLSEPSDPSKAFEFTLQQRHPIDDYRAGEMATTLVTRYIDGEGRDGPIPMPDVDGYSIAPTNELFALVAGICCMQPMDLGPSDRYSPEDLAAIAVVAPSVWVQLIAKCSEVQSGPKAETSEDLPPIGSASESETSSLN